MLGCRPIRTGFAKGTCGNFSDFHSAGGVSIKYGCVLVSVFRYDVKMLFYFSLIVNGGDPAAVMAT